MSVPPGYPPGPAQPVPGPPPGQPGCFRHLDRPTGLRCTRCDRPACPECLREASVGYHCVECVSVAQRQVRRARTVAGASLQERPVAVPLLIGLNLAVFFVTVAQAGSIGRNFNAPLFVDWVTWPRAIVGNDEWWRLITGGFLHYGLVHVALNMIALWFLGRVIEPLLGWARFTAVYLLSLLGGSTAVFAFSDVDTGAAGASGAVFGLLGASLVAVIRLKWNPQPILMMLALNAVISFLPGISLLGHLGGFIVGVALTAAMMYAPRERRTLIQGAAVAGVFALLVLIIALRSAQLSSML